MEKKLILHMFQWNLNDVREQLSKVKAMGFDYIQISPVTPTKEEWNREFWLLYQPIDFTIGNYLGSKEELINLCRDAAKYDIKIICDVVLRHLASDNYNALIPHDLDNNYIKSRGDFWLERRNFNEGDRWEETNLCSNLPGLNYNNRDLQNIYIMFLDELIECGVHGFRIDMGKHFSLPEEGCNFWANVFERYKDRFNYAECLDCNRELLDQYAKYIDVVSNCECSNRNKLVSFFESHDTYYTFKYTCKMTDEDRLREWEVLLNNYKNLLFFLRPYDGLFENERLKRLNLKYK